MSSWTWFDMVLSDLIQRDFCLEASMTPAAESLKLPLYCFLHYHPFLVKIHTTDIKPSTMQKCMLPCF